MTNHLWRTFPKASLCCGALLLGLLPHAFPKTSSVILEDKFEDGDRSSQKPDLGTPPYSSIPWQTGSPGVLKVETGSLILASHAGPAKVWGFFAPQGSPVSLKVGESIRFSFTFSYDQPPGNFADFRFGLFNFGSSPRATGKNFVSSDIRGYFVTTGTQHAKSDGSRLYALDNSGTPGETLNHKSDRAIPVGDPFPSINAMTDTHTAVLTVTRSGEATVDVAASLDGAEDPGLAWQDDSLRLTAFDSVAMFFGKLEGDNTLRVREIRIELITQ